MTEAEQLRRIRTAIFAIVNALGGALPHTPEVLNALNALAESDIDS